VYPQIFKKNKTQKQMKNKTILLSNLLAQREIEVLLESIISEIDMAAAKETVKDIQDSPQYQKIRDEIAKEIKDPQKTKAVAKGIVEILMKANEIFKSTMTSEKKRKVLKTFFASKLAIIGGVAGKVWDIIRVAVKSATTIHYDGVFGISALGGFDKAGTVLGDPFILDFLGMALPYMLGLRALLAIYDVEGTIKSAKDTVKSVAGLGKKAASFAKDVRDTVTDKDVTNETLNEDDDFDIEDAALKAIDLAI